MFSKSTVKLRRRKGNFTPAVAILMVFFVLLATLTIDYSRFNSVQPIVRSQLNNAIDIALLDYDSDLKNGYDLYGVTDQQKLREQIEYYLNKSLAADDFTTPYHVVIEQVTVDSSIGDLTDKGTLRQMIIENHSKAFIANKLTDWLERLDILRDLSKVIDMVEQFNKVVERVSKLEKMYRDLEDLYNQFEDWQTTAQNFDGAAIADQLLDLYDDLAEVEDDIREQRNKDDKDAWSVYQDGLLDTELYHLMDVRSRIEGDIDDAKELLSDFIEQTDIVFDLLTKTKQFSDQLAVVCDDVQAILDTLPTDSLEAFNQRLGSVVTNITDYARQILTSLESANQAFNQQITEIDNLANETRRYVDLLDDLLNAESFDPSDYQNELTLEGQITFSVIDILVRQDAADAPFSFSAIFDILYDRARQTVETQFGYNYGDIPQDIYDQLPSSSLGQQAPIYEISPRTTGDKFAQSEALHEQMDQSIDFTKLLSEAALSGSQALIEKMIIIDYVLNHFSHNYDDEQDVEKHNRYFSTAEVEYIINGDRVGSTNALMTEAGIFGMRTALNAVSILAFKQSQLTVVSTELAALTGGVSYPLVYGLCVIGWASIESGIDIFQLKEGEPVLFFKMANDINFDLSLEALANFSGQAEVTKVVDQINPLAFEYEDYLFLILLTQDEDLILYRIMDMISVSDLLTDSELANYKTGLSVTVHYRLDSWFGTSLANVTKGIASKQYVITLKRGY